MTNYILLACIILLCIGVVISNERRNASQVRRARWDGMREGINLTAMSMQQGAREAWSTFHEQNPIDIEERAAKLTAMVELEEWGEL